MLPCTPELLNSDEELSYSEKQCPSSSRMDAKPPKHFLFTVAASQIVAWVSSNFQGYDSDRDGELNFKETLGSM